MAKDLICGMEVDEKTAQFKSEYKGNTYYFCSGGCKTTFDSNPEKYIGAKEAPKEMPKEMPKEAPKAMPKEAPKPAPEKAKKPWYKFW